MADLQLLFSYIRLESRSSIYFLFYILFNSAGWTIFNIFFLYSAGEPIFNILSSIRPNGRSLISCCMIRPKVCSSIYFLSSIRPDGRSSTSFLIFGRMADLQRFCFHPQFGRMADLQRSSFHLQFGRMADL